MDASALDELTELARREAHHQAQDASFRRRVSLNYLSSFVKSGRPLPWPPEQSGVTMEEVMEVAAGGLPVVSENEGRAWAMRGLRRESNLAAAEATDPVDPEGA